MIFYFVSILSLFLFFELCVTFRLQEDVTRKADSDSDLCLAVQDLDWSTNIEPVSFHQPNLNYTVNPCYQPNNNGSTEFTNRDEPYVILNLHRR